MKILVIAPHPDDEVLGCGGIIKKYTKEGSEVCLCIVTKGYTPDWTEEFIENRKKEVDSSAKILGIEKVFFLDFPTVKLDTIPQKDINNAIAKCIGEVRPEVLYIPHRGDLSKDHRIVFESALVASRPKPNFSIKKVFSYEVLSSTEWGNQKIEKIEDVFLPNVYIDISDTIRDKLEAIKCYKPELKEFPHPRSLKGIIVLSEKRGMESGLKNAEAFMLIKEVIK
ncbi:MAG: LmbE family protein [Parcubacteria group bacterium Licking1014_1]|nr:MAG: LmbE family protein [Parcubacteria group bacterium Licking1014_1]